MPLARALAERNYDTPTPVQTAVLAGSAGDRDLLVSAQTGSGKTVAYGLAIAHNLLGDADAFEAATAPLALIVAPTRELALQVQREIAWLYQYAGARVVSCVGGTDPRREQRELAEGAHIVVGTPGRLCDHLRRRRLDISGLKAVVLDEADEMLDLGFREDLELILEGMPDVHRTLMFSATLPREIIALAGQYQNDALRIEVAGDDGGHADIEHRAIRVAAHDVEHAVVNLLRYFESPATLVFCNTRNAVRHLQTSLLERGFSVVALSGELAQNERTLALQALRDGRARVCVATDVAARGIDLPSLDLVIHADLPHDPEVLQHRSGRTGRAGRKGVSVLLVPPARRRRVDMMLLQAGIEAAWGSVPQAEEIRALDQQRMLQDGLLAEEPTEEDVTWAQALLAQRTPEQIAAALVRIYRTRLPSPEDILDPGEERGRGRHDRREAKNGATMRAHEPDAGERSNQTSPGQGPSGPNDSVWFRASIGRRNNAEVRWLLPMICRRGGIDKNAIGAIRVYDGHTEIEISGQTAELFAANITRPDKEAHIRLEAMPDGPQASAPSGRHERSAGRGKPAAGKARSRDNSRREHGPKPFGASAGHGPVEFKKKKGFAKKRRYQDKPGHAGKNKHAGGRKFGKPAFGKASGGSDRHV